MGVVNDTSNPTPTAGGLRNLIRESDMSRATAESYRQMLKLAIDLGLGYEIERMTASITEYMDDANDRTERAVEMACDMGMTPEEFEAFADRSTR